MNLTDTKNYSKLFDLARDGYGYLSYKFGNGKAIVPLRYSLELTYRCNLNCPYCYIGNSRQKEELTTDDWIKIINQIPFWGFVTLVGGEPLIRKDFLDIYNHSMKKVNRKVNVVTNGILLKEEILKHFIATKLLLLSVSIDGYGENHDINRDRKGLFDTVTKNLENLKELKGKNKYPLLDIKTIILQNNLDDLVKIYKLCEDLNADFLSLAFLRNNDLKQNSILRTSFGEEFYKTEYPIDPYFDMEHFAEVYKELKSLSKKGKTQLRFAPKFDGGDELKKIKAFFSQNPSNPVSEVYKPCLYPWSNTIITPEGNMYPCLSLKIGNVKEKSIMEVWNSPHFRCFRKNLQVSKVFNACQMCCELTPIERKEIK